MEFTGEIDQNPPHCTGSCEVCYGYLWGSERNKPASERQLPDDCSGLLVDGRWFPDEYEGDGYFIQVCPRQSTLGSPPSGIGFCGNGPDVIVVHSDREPTEEEYGQIMKESWELF